MLLSYISMGSAIEINKPKGAPVVAQIQPIEVVVNNDPTTFVYYFDLINAFMQGAYAANYFPNTQECVRNGQ